MTRYTRALQIVMDDGKWLCEAVDELAAMQILNALRAIEDADRRVSAPITLNECRVMQQGDEMACECGLRWAVDDDRPPLCVHRAPRSRVR